MTPFALQVEAGAGLFEMGGGCVSCRRSRLGVSGMGVVRFGVGDMGVVRLGVGSM